MSRLPMARLELNLLVPLDALLTERSVTRAATKLGLSQPTLSAALARLRIHFEDPLLVRDGSAFRLSPLAVRLVDQTATALESARKVFSSEATFVPEKSEHEFTIYGSDYSFVTVGSAVAAAAHRTAPGVRFRFVHHTTAIIEDAHQTLRSVDGMLLPHGAIRGLPSIEVYSDDWVCIVDRDNAAVGERLTMANLAELPWVVSYQGLTGTTPAARQLHLAGVEPRIDVVVEGFLALPAFIAGTERLGLVQSSVAAAAAEALGLRVLRLPFTTTPIAGALWWHPLHTDDPAHQWMRHQFAQFHEQA